MVDLPGGLQAVQRLPTGAINFPFPKLLHLRSDQESSCNTHTLTHSHTHTLVLFSFRFRTRSQGRGRRRRHGRPVGHGVSVWPQAQLRVSAYKAVAVAISCACHQEAPRRRRWVRGVVVVRDQRKLGAEIAASIIAIGGFYGRPRASVCDEHLQLGSVRRVGGDGTTDDLQVPASTRYRAGVRVANGVEDASCSVTVERLVGRVASFARLGRRRWGWRGRRRRRRRWTR